jgi:hypothetical protein
MLRVKYKIYLLYTYTSIRLSNKEYIYIEREREREKFQSVICAMNYLSEVKYKILNNHGKM